MSEIDIAFIKKKSIKGVVALIQRTFLLQIIGIVSISILGAYLPPAIFGIFGLVNAFIGFLSYFSDVGLAGALIQKKEELTQKDLATTFTVQQLLIGFLVVGSLLFSKQIAGFYGLNDNGIWLLRSLLVSFFLSSLKTIPSVILERNLDFNKLVIPQIVETLGYNIVTVFLAWRGFGIWSFTIGALTRGILGLITMYLVAPWRISVGFDKEVAKRLFRFGIPFQWNSFLALLKDDLLFLFLGKILPLEQLGYITWAKKWAEFPLRMIMDNVIRVTFPAYSRMQHDVKLLGGAIEKTLFGISLAVFPIYVGLLWFMNPLIHIIPRYGKWEMAMISFYLFSLTSVSASIATPLINALNAIGKINISLLFMVLWLILSWILTLTFIHVIGFNGFALALLCISFTGFLVAWYIKRIVPFTFFKNIRMALMGAIAQMIWYALIIPRISWQLPILITVGLIGVLIYSAIVWLGEKERIILFATALRRT